MKRLSILSVIAAVFAALFLLVPSASAATGGVYNAGFQVQNLSSTAASINISFYNQDGSVASSVTDTVAASDSNTYFPLQNAPTNVSAGFDGSVVISSNQPIAAIANVLRDNSGINQGSSYSGFDGGSNSISLPLINKSFFNIDTRFNVQNAGADSADVTVKYVGTPATTCTETATIVAGAAHTFDQASNTCLPSNFVGAATVTTADSSDAIVATALQVANNGLFAYNGFTSGSTNPVIPLISNNVFGFQTGIQIQNQGTQSTNITVTYTPVNDGVSPASPCTETKTVAAGNSDTFTLGALTAGSPVPTTSNCPKGSYFVGSAEVTGNSSSQPLVAIINQTDFSSKGSAYNSFNKSEATDTVVMPLVMNAFNIFTGYNVLNVGSSNTNVTCTYSSNSTGSPSSDSATLAPGQAMNEVQTTGNGFPAGYIGSATCTASGGGSIVGVVNQAKYAPGVGEDSTLTYEAFNN